MEVEDYTKLSVEEACSHKSWKARLICYESALKQFATIESDVSPEWNKFIGLMKNFIMDSHALCQEKGLEAVLYLVKNCGFAGRTASDVVSGIIQKCLAAPKARIKDLGSQVVLMYIEIEKHEIVVEELLKGTESKNPKATAASVHVLAQALRDFGPKVITIGKLLKRVPSLLNDRDTAVRQETKMLVVEMYRWLGPAIKTQLTAVLKPVHLSEIESEYEKVKDESPAATRLLRSQQAKKKLAITDNNTGDGSADCKTKEVPVEETDPLDSLEPVDILSQLNKEFYPKLESMKWVERKEALEELDKLLQVSPKLKNADYGDLLRTLKKVVQQDSNVVVVGFAVKCITGIAYGLKKKFHQYSDFIMPALLEKFKERKQNVLLALRDAVDAVSMSTNLEALQDDILACLNNKNPSIKVETAAFLTRCFTKATPSILTKKLMKPLCKGLCTAIRDQDPTVRESACIAIGTAMKVVGEKTIGTFIVDVDANLMKKIKEYSDKAEITPKLPASKPIKTVSKTSSEEREKSNIKVVKLISGAKSKPEKSFLISAPTNKIEMFSREKALTTAENIVPGDVYNGLLSDNSADQIAAGHKLKEIINTIPINNDSGPALLSLFMLNDFRTYDDGLILKIEILKSIAERFPLPREGLHSILFDISSHITNSACSTLIAETLTIFASNITLNVVVKGIFSDEFSTNLDCNASLWTEKFNWIYSAIMSTDYLDEPSFLFEIGRKLTSHVNTQVRNVGLALVGAAYLKTSSEVANGRRAKPRETTESFVKHENITTNNEVQKIKSAVSNERSKPLKLDLGPKLSEALMDELADKNWKIRAEAIDKVQALVNSSHSITSNLGDAAPVIAARITDSNTKICASAIALVESLASAMGASCKRHIPVFLPALIKTIGDQKVWIRSAVITCLNTWGDICGYEKFFEGEVIADALKTGSSSVRTELWSWLAVKLPDIPTKSTLKQELTACLNTLYSSFEDRNAEVRRNACEAALGVMMHIGFNKMIQALNDAKGSGRSARVIRDILEKTRDNLPSQPLPNSKSGSSALEISERRMPLEKLGPADSSATITKSKKSSLPQSKSCLLEKQEETDLQLLQVNSLKYQRVIDEQKMKILEWNFITPGPEFIELLTKLMYSANVNQSIIANMFHFDSRHRIHAIDSLANDIPVNKEALKCNLDLILKWITLQFFEDNPSVLLRALEYLQIVFQVLIDDNYSMLDSEGAGFIPYLILKTCDPKESVRSSVRTLLKLLASLYPKNKQFFYLLEGLKSDNALQRSECLDQLSWLIENYGVTVCHPSTARALNEIVKHIADRDIAVHNSALNCVVTAYFIEGEKVFKMCGEMSDKEIFLLEEWVKRAAKNDRPLNAVKPFNVELRSQQDLNLLLEHVVSELVHLSIILNQSDHQSHPSGLKYCNAIFSLLMELCQNPELCSQISESTLYNIIEQFLLLLSERKFEFSQNKYCRVLNVLVLRLLQNCNKTNVMCVLLKMLFVCVSNPKALGCIKNLVVKCLWKINQSQSEWDSELDYSRILSEFHTFLKAYPRSWWKNEEDDFPLRTIKTVLHSMVKIRGTKVRDLADRMPNVSKDSELYVYLKKVIKHLKLDNAQETPNEQSYTDIPRLRDSVSTASNGIAVSRESPETTCCHTKEEDDELNAIFETIDDHVETAQANNDDPAEPPPHHPDENLFGLTDTASTASNGIAVSRESPETTCCHTKGEDDELNAIFETIDDHLETAQANNDDPAEPPPHHPDENLFGFTDTASTASNGIAVSRESPETTCFHTNEEDDELNAIFETIDNHEETAHANNDDPAEPTPHHPDENLFGFTDTASTASNGIGVSRESPETTCCHTKKEDDELNAIFETIDDHVETAHANNDDPAEPPPHHPDENLFGFTDTASTASNGIGVSRESPGSPSCQAKEEEYELTGIFETIDDHEETAHGNNDDPAEPPPPSNENICFMF